MNKKRLIITSVISIILVSILFIGSTYSIFTSSDIDENLNSYTTGTLSVSVEGGNTVNLEDSLPTSSENAGKIIPYRIVVRNTGNVPYMFNVILADTTAGEVIDYKYLMTKVGKLEDKSLDSCTETTVTVNSTSYTGRIIKEGIIIPPKKGDVETVVNIDVRVWVSDTVQNTEIGKSFYGKLLIDGQAVYDYNEDIDNSVLSSGLSSVAIGSYVAYTGTNGCPDGHCDGTNANYVSDTDMGYCLSSSYKFSVNGWRVGYIQNDTAYLISAGATECMCTNADGTPSNSNCSNSETTGGVPLHLANLDSKALTYCNPSYAFGGTCDSNSAWAMDAIDFEAITGTPLYFNSSSDNSCYNVSNSTECGYGNDLIDNGGAYWFATAFTSSSESPFYWIPYSRCVNYNNSTSVYGVRPVLRLASSVQVVGGSGTYEEPYQISP